jgi:L-rhamnose isomerase
VALRLGWRNLATGLALQIEISERVEKWTLKQVQGDGEKWRDDIVMSAGERRSIIPEVKQTKVMKGTRRINFHQPPINRSNFWVSSDRSIKRSLLKGQLELSIDPLA